MWRIASPDVTIQAIDYQVVKNDLTPIQSVPEHGFAIEKRKYSLY